MKIIVNGEVQNSAAETVQELLAEQGMADAKVATAVNETFVPSGMRATQILNDGDRVEIVAPRQGG